MGEIARDLGLRSLEAEAMMCNMEAHNLLQEDEESKAACEMALELYQDDGNRLGEAKTLVPLADHAFRTGDPSAMDRARRADAAFKVIGDRRMVARGKLMIVDLLQSA